MTEKPKTWLNPYVLAFIIGAFFLTVLRPFLKREPTPPPKLKELPSFQLKNQDNQKWGTSDMKGKVYLVDFFFTSCPSICLQLTQSMKKLQTKIAFARLPIHLLSISVDSDTDTPVVLKNYAKKHEISLRNWTFLTGTTKEIQTLVEKGFQVVVGKKKKTVQGIDIAHSQKIILVDPNGFIRGYYPSTQIGLDEALHRSVHVLREYQLSQRKK